ncbi:MAG: hypothetical protein R3D71_07560 [Rickettsiales bacterium]
MPKRVEDLRTEGRVLHIIPCKKKSAQAIYIQGISRTEYSANNQPSRRFFSHLKERINIHIVF